jgi:hypothetical protein
MAIAAAMALLVMNLLAIISVFRSDRGVESKAMWAISITLMPFVGIIYWLVVAFRRFR